jgi:hypothetical protein
MRTAVERFKPDPMHGRPKIATFTTSEGELAVHCARDDGSLWVFAHGPRGGDRGECAWGLGRANEVLGWLDRDDRSPLYSSHGWLVVSARVVGGGVILSMFKGGSLRSFSISLDEAAHREFRTCLREWAEAVVRLQQNGS